MKRKSQKTLLVSGLQTQQIQGQNNPKIHISLRLGFTHYLFIYFCTNIPVDNSLSVRPNMSILRYISLSVSLTLYSRQQQQQQKYSHISHSPQKIYLSSDSPALCLCLILKKETEVAKKLVYMFTMERHSERRQEQSGFLVVRRRRTYEDVYSRYHFGRVAVCVQNSR